MQKEKANGWSPGEARYMLPDVLSQWDHMDTHHSVMMCGNTCKVVSAKEAHLSLGVQGFYKASVMLTCHICASDLSYLDYSPLPQQKWMFALNHTVSISYLIKCIRQTKNTLIKQNIPRTQRSPPKSQPWVCPNDRSFLEMCRFWAIQPNWINTFLDIRNEKSFCKQLGSCIKC